MCPDPSGASAPCSFPLEARFSAAPRIIGWPVFQVLCHHLLPFDLLCPSPYPSRSCSHPCHCLSLNVHSDNSQIFAPSLATFLHSGPTSNGRPVRSAPEASHGLFQLSPSQVVPSPCSLDWIITTCLLPASLPQKVPLIHLHGTKSDSIA